MCHIFKDVKEEEERTGDISVTKEHHYPERELVSLTDEGVADSVRDSSVRVINNLRLLLFGTHPCSFMKCSKCSQLSD